MKILLILLLLGAGAIAYNAHKNLSETKAQLAAATAQNSELTEELTKTKQRLAQFEAQAQRPQEFTPTPGAVRRPNNAPRPGWGTSLDSRPR